jgi:hypothetical protein
MKLETAIRKVVEFLENNPGSTKEQIGTATKVKGIELANALRAIRKSGRLQEEGEGKEAVFTVTAEETAGTGEEHTEETPDAEEEVAPVASKGRNNDKYQFGGESYGKGPLVREVVRQYVADNPRTTLKKLKEVFPDDLLHRFGIFQELDRARELSGARERYFFKDEHQIKLGDKVVVVCNQLTAANIQPFLKAAKALGYKIK